MPEVSHDAMGPYLAFAAAGSMLHAFTAVRMPPSWSGLIIAPASSTSSSLILHPCTAAAVGGECERRW